RPMPWRGRHVFLVSASPGAVGGIRGLWQTRIPLEGCGALVFPDMFAVPHAGEAFAADGSLADAAHAERLRQMTLGFYRLSGAIAPLCCGEPSVRRDEITRALEHESRIQPAAKGAAR